MSSTMVQMRNVPSELHRKPKAKAALEELSMSDFGMREIRKALDRPTRQETLERLKARPVRRLRRSAAEVIRGERDTR